MFRLYRNEREERKIQSANVATLCDSVRFFRTRDSLSAASVTALRFTNAELKRYAAEQRVIAEKLGIKLRDVQSIADTRLELNLALSSRLEKKSDTLWQYKAPPSPFLDFSQQINPETGDFTTQIRVPIRLTTIAHAQWRVKFLWMRFGLKGVKATTVTDNPHVTVTGHQYILKR